MQPAAAKTDRGTSTILLLAYYFPPLSDTASLRYVSFCRYSLEHGLRPIVLTVKNPDLSYCTQGNEPPPTFDGVTVHRARSVANVYWLIKRADAALNKVMSGLGFTRRRDVIAQLVMPDIFAGWIPLALVKALKVVKREKPEAIVAGCKPMSGAVLGVLLKKLTGLPLVIDLQDPWRLELMFEYARQQRARFEPPLKLTQWFTRIIESWIMRWVDHVVVASEDNRQMYLRAYPYLAGKVSVVHIGFSDAFAPSAGVPQAVTSGKFTLLYTGNFYYYMDPTDSIFRVIRNLLDKGAISSQDFQFVFVGSYGAWLRRLTERYALQDVIKTPGVTSQAGVRKYLDEATMLFIRLYRPCTNLSTKVFEAMAVGTPILAHIDPGEQSELIQRYSRSFAIAAVDDEAALEAALCGAVEKWRSGTLKREIDNVYVQRHNARATTGALAAIIHRCIRKEGFV
jgi:glycosyltransferase involved in cell wall biosynthesis